MTHSQVYYHRTYDWKCAYLRMSETYNCGRNTFLAISYQELCKLCVTHEIKFEKIENRNTIMSRLHSHVHSVHSLDCDVQKLKLACLKRTPNPLDTKNILISAVSLNHKSLNSQPRRPTECTRNPISVKLSLSSITRPSNINAGLAIDA